MKRKVVALTASLCIFPLPAFSGWFDTKEQVTLAPKLSVPQPIKEDAYIKATTSTTSLPGMCSDNFLYALSRNVMGAHDKTLVVLTYDSQPVLTVEYDQKTRSCNKDFIVESDLTRYMLRSKVNEQHKINLVYASDENVKSLQNALHFATPFVAASSPAGAILALPITQEITTSLDNAFANAVSTHDNQSAGFKLPDNSDQTKLTLYATIGSRSYRLMDLYLSTKNSLLESKGFQDIMNTSLDSSATVKEGILSRRSKEGIAFKEGDYGVIKSECGYLRSNYQNKLNTWDMQRLQEAYLLESHRDMITKKSLQQCLGYTIDSPHRELTFQLLADLITPSPEVLDTYFVKLLTTGESEKILPPTAKLNDRDTNLRMSTVTDYINLRKVSPAACHTALSYNRVGFIQSIGDQRYFLTASVDRLYSKSEAEQGKLPLISIMSISTIPDDEYTDIYGVNRCVNDWTQSRKVASN